MNKKEKERLRKRKRRAQVKAYRRIWWNHYLKGLKCYFCGETETCCLDHHHIDPSEKEQNIPKLLGKWYSFEFIAREITKCVVLCSNCHRKLHAGVIELKIPFAAEPPKKPHDWI